MSLQRRLTLIFIAIVVLPLAVAGYIFQRLVVGEVDRRALLTLTPALDTTELIFGERAESVEARTRGALVSDQIARLLRQGDAQGLQERLSAQLQANANLDFLIAVDTSGQVLASARRDPKFTAGFEAPENDSLRATQIGPGFVSTGEIPYRIRFGEDRSELIGYVVGGFWVDQDFLFEPRDELKLLIVVNDRVIASTDRAAAGRRVDVPSGDEVFSAQIGEPAKAEARSLGGGMFVLAATPTAPIDALAGNVVTSMVLVLLLATIGTIALAYALARFITQPLEEVSAAASEIAEGRFETEVPVRSRDEVGRLGEAFNEMTERLRETITQLSLSRDQVEKAIRRFGETLKSTHDMNQLLDSILDVAAETVDADCGIVWLLTSNREAVHPARIVGPLTNTPTNVAMGEGIVGRVANTGSILHVSSAEALDRAPGEPPLPVSLATPLFTQGQVSGVLSLYRRTSVLPFDEKDVDTVAFLTEHAGVAIENVLLHEEAQKLSLTDGLTGVWNRRYFSMQFRQSIATAARYNREFSLLMLDLDHFKRVNDTYGHRRGDEVLSEVAGRVGTTLREVDTLARYGGEEFICLLSETDSNGAAIVAEKIREVIRAEAFGRAPEEPVWLTISVGISTYPQDGPDFQSLVEAADRALYRAKKLGRNRVVVAADLDSPTMADESASR